MRFLAASGSLSQNWSWRKTRMVFMPMESAIPSSLSMSAGLKVAAWNISSSLMASEGTKLAPTSHGCC